MGKQKQVSEELLNKLTEFVVCELAEKVLDGITYTLVIKTPRDRPLYKKYMEIKKEAIKCGYDNNELFRVYEVPNGYIFDLDISVARTIIDKIYNTIAEAENWKGLPNGVLGNGPSQRRISDMRALGKYIKQQYDSGARDIEVALFSRNSSNTIVISGKGPKGEKLAVKYHAYAIRHWDIEALNSNILIPLGIRVDRVAPSEILPSKTGVRFVLSMEEIKK